MRVITCSYTPKTNKFQFSLRPSAAILDSAILDSAIFPLEMILKGEDNIEIIFSVSISVLLQILLMKTRQKRKKLTLIFILTTCGHTGFGHIGTKDDSDGKNNIEVKFSMLMLVLLEIVHRHILQKTKNSSFYRNGLPPNWIWPFLHLRWPQIMKTTLEMNLAYQFQYY